MKNFFKHPFARFVFSLWLVYHVFVILMMPNGTSYVGRTLGPVIRPYAAILGLNASWNFFSPDPAHTMYMKFTLYDEDEVKEPREIYFPAQKDQGVWDLGERRNLYAMRYFLLDPRRIEAILGPYLCRHEAPVSVVRIEHVVNSVPSLDEAVLFRERGMSEMSQEFESVNREYRCSQVNDEVDL